jgi:TolB-like protein/Flp pilus assembly protein TadD
MSSGSVNSPIRPPNAPPSASYANPAIGMASASLTVGDRKAGATTTAAQSKTLLPVTSPRAPLPSGKNRESAQSRNHDHSCVTGLSYDLAIRPGFADYSLWKPGIPNNVLYLFDNFTVDTDRRDLRGVAGVIHVEPQVFDLMLYFARNANRVISKDELIEQIWQGRAISDAALNSRINATRRAIGDTGKRQTFIRTIQRRGFLFDAEVTERVSRQPTSESMATSMPAPSFAPPPDKPSIAVLPFQNLSGDPRQDYFADGVVADIITGLARIKWLFVVARNSSFFSKGQAIDVKRIGCELGARYVLEGSLRKIGERVRLSAQLIEAETGIHLLAERYDRRLEDVFALQDEIALSVVTAVEPTLRDAEIDRVARKRPENLDAYALALRAIHHLYIPMPEQATKAMPLLEQALALGPNHAVVHGLLAWCNQVLFLRTRYKEDNRLAAIRHARTAVALGRNDAMALSLGAFVIGKLEHDRPAAFDAFDRALALSPSSAFPLFIGCIVPVYAGCAERALELAEEALRVGRNDRLGYLAHHCLALAYFCERRYEESATAARRAVEANPDFSVSHGVFAAALAKLDRLEEARMAGARVLTLHPSFSARQFCAAVGAVPVLAEQLTDAWRKAELPA